MSLSELMIDIPAEHEANVFGQFDAYAKKLERTFHVTLIARDGRYEDCRRKYGCGKNAYVFSLSFWNYHGVEILLRNRMWIMQFHLFLKIRRRE